MNESSFQMTDYVRGKAVGSCSSNTGCKTSEYGNSGNNIRRLFQAGNRTELLLCRCEYNYGPHGSRSDYTDLVVDIRENVINDVDARNLNIVSFRR